ncbi:MAG: hypothetical protein WB762_23500 [Candidatus Sulfotelmatobacter sp.]
MLFKVYNSRLKQGGWTLALLVQALETVKGLQRDLHLEVLLLSEDQDVDRWSRLLRAARRPNC